MKQMLQVVRGFVLLAMVIPAVAQTEGDFTYTNDGSAITITRYSAKALGGVVIVPREIAGLPVRAIGEFAFADRPAITSVTLPDTVTNIGKIGFGLCTGLTNIVIPNGVVGIGGSAFQYCYLLPAISLPSSVVAIGEKAFSECTNLAAITVADGNPAFRSSAGVLFNQDGTRLIQAPGGIHGEYVIPEGVTAIEAWACFGSPWLTRVSIPGSVTNIGSRSLQSCPRLAAIDVRAPNPEYYSVDGVLFKSVHALMQFPQGRLEPSYTTPPSATAIEYRAFSDCTNLTSIAFADAMSYLGDAAFAYCTGLTSVRMGKGVAVIGGATFAHCTNLTRICFEGAAPGGIGPGSFFGVPATVYYLPGTAGWEPTFAGLPTAPWLPTLENQDARYGLSSNRFSFTIMWARDRVVTVEAAASLTSPVWTPVATITLVHGLADFDDSAWSGSPSQYYRVRSP